MNAMTMENPAAKKKIDVVRLSPNRTGSKELERGIQIPICAGT
jgi:hypothetical protein